MRPEQRPLADVGLHCRNTASGPAKWIPTVSGLRPTMWRKWSIGSPCFRYGRVNQRATAGRLARDHCSTGRRFPALYSGRWTAHSSFCSSKSAPTRLTIGSLFGKMRPSRSVLLGLHPTADPRWRMAIIKTCEWPKVLSPLTSGPLLEGDQARPQLSTL